MAESPPVRQPGKPQAGARGQIFTFPLTCGLIVYAYRHGYMSSTPWWYYVASVMLSGTVGTLTTRYACQHPNKRWALHLDAGTLAIINTNITYMAGWGSMQIASHVISMSEAVVLQGSRVSRTQLRWALGCTLVGEVGVALGWLPSVLPSTMSHLVAVFGCGAVVVISRQMEATQKRVEAQEAQLAEDTALFEQMVRNASDVIGVLTPDAVIQSVSPASRQVLGRDHRKAVNTNLLKYLSVTSQADLREAIDLLIGDNPPSSVVRELGVVGGRRGDRVVVATLSRLAPTDPDAIAFNLHDITQERAYETQLRFEASHDPLSGLMNRLAFTEAAERACSHASRHGTAIGAIYIDLDGFKAINDTLGHSHGDALIAKAGERILDALESNPETLAARLGGDEFAVLVESTSDDHLSQLCDEIRQHLQGDGGEESTSIPASVGYSILSGLRIDPVALLRQADQSMYEQKRSGRERDALGEAS